MAIEVHPSIFTHPGPWLRRNYVKPNNLTVRATASVLGVTGVQMNNLLSGRAALSADMAMRIEKAFGLAASTPHLLALGYAGLLRLTRLSL
ncbi:addiction module HigA family antidote [Novosphingobium sp. PhB55]|uniref:HigA family addiction module antitoxin n=1 Tax=Novosphingobium sp. PhB55 TaxID=2485106 RepID=UPI001065211F|nr:HigA family addiction module antitoxin [Novosphingobium sp. PhB55]TDW65407.1 addiction module HigA family antidote [Novosphingobium sp. PhB55]